MCGGRYSHSERIRRQQEKKLGDESREVPTTVMDTEGNKGTVSRKRLDGEE